MAPQADDETAMVEHLEQTGRYRVLRKLAPREVKPHLHPPADRTPGSWPRLGVILDAETTGVDHAAHEVIELGMVAFTYDQAGVRDVVAVLSELQQPEGPITPYITRITGITDEMVAGQRIDVEAVPLSAPSSGRQMTKKGGNLPFRSRTWVFESYRKCIATLSSLNASAQCTASSNPGYGAITA